MNIFECNPQNWVENETFFLQQLEDEKTWNAIPLLNVNELHNLKDSTLVRFRGMIQDMHSPEYYLEQFEVISDKTEEKTYRNGKYCDAMITKEDESVNMDSDMNVTSERHTYVIISIPGINNWVEDIEKSQFAIKQEFTVSLNSKMKRTYDEAMSIDDNKEMPSTSSNSEDGQKKSCNDVKQQDKTLLQTIVSKEHFNNFPLPGSIGKKCHLKLYKNQDKLKLNDVCEFIGFLAIDPIAEAAFHEDDDFENRLEQETLHPPSSLVPRIHCVTFKKLTHNNPLLHSEEDQIHMDRFEIIRKELLIVLTQLLLGDDLAAEYLILHLLSKVYMRRDFLPLGKFSLNISNIPLLGTLDYVVEVYKFIEILVPKSYYLPMTLENMNDLQLTPKKDYECNRLTSGILQLSHNTHLVLDETKLSTGKLNSSGISSIRALAEVIKHQKLAYDFNYYQLEYDCDIPFFILSEGKSLLGSDVHVVLKPEKICIDTFTEIVDAAKHFLKPELLNDFRKYLTLARLTKYEITENVEDLVQKEFVNMRQKGNVTADDLHSLLVLARLVTISQGKTIMDADSWKKACSLEKQRKSRISE